MKIIIEVPDSTLAIGLNFVYNRISTNETMIGSKVMDSDDIKAAKVKEDCEE